MYNITFLCAHWCTNYTNYCCRNDKVATTAGVVLRVIHILFFFYVERSLSIYVAGLVHRPVFEVLLLTDLKTMASNFCTHKY